jgi:hypothetical protein
MQIKQVLVICDQHPDLPDEIVRLRCSGRSTGMPFLKDWGHELGSNTTESAGHSNAIAEYRHQFHTHAHSRLHKQSLPSIPPPSKQQLTF